MRMYGGRCRVVAVMLCVVVPAVVVLVPAVVVLDPAPAAGLSTAAVGTQRDVRQAWDWPVSPPRQVQRSFEAPPTPYSAGHRGIDVTAAPGQTVLAAAAGVVSFSGVVVDRPVLSVKHDGGLVSSVEPVAATLATGDVVRAGDAVGVVGSGGHCESSCVHVGVRLHGEYINPMALLGFLDRAVLLPLGR